MTTTSALSLALLHVTDEFSWTQWTFYPDFLIGWFLLGIAYALAAGPLRKHFPGSEPVPTRKVLWFAAGMLVMPPLLLMGIPGWMVRPIVRVRPLYALAWFLTFPLVAFFLNNGIFLIWHFPAPYDLMMRNHDVHVLMHLMIMFSGMLMWWPVLSPLPELPRIAGPLQMIYLFVLGIPMMIAAAMITFSGEALYTFYVEAPRIFNLSPLEDQQLGGAIMWVPGALVIWFAITLVYFHWSNRDAAEDEVTTTGRIAVTRSGMVIAPPPMPDEF